VQLPFTLALIQSQNHNTVLHSSTSLKKKKMLSYTYSCSFSFTSCWLYWRTFTISPLACFKLSNLSPRALYTSQLCVMPFCVAQKSIQNPCFTS
jgi:hypothetical protein